MRRPAVPVQETPASTGRTASPAPTASPSTTVNNSQNAPSTTTTTATSSTVPATRPTTPAPSGAVGGWLGRRAQRYLVITLFAAPWLLALRQMTMLLHFTGEYSQWSSAESSGGKGEGAAPGSLLLPMNVHTRTLLTPSLLADLFANASGPLLSWEALRRMREEGIYDDDCKLKPDTIDPRALPRSQPLPLSYDDYIRCSRTSDTAEAAEAEQEGEGDQGGGLHPALAVGADGEPDGVEGEAEAEAEEAEGYAVEVAACGHLDYMSRKAPIRPCTYTIQEGEDGVGALYSRAFVAMVYAYQQGCDFVFSDPPHKAWNDGASYHVLPQIGPVYCHTNRPPTDPDPAKHKPPPDTDEGWEEWWSGLSCHAVDWPAFFNLPRLTAAAVEERQRRGEVLCRVHFNEAHRYLSLLTTQRLQGPVERAVETVRSGFASAVHGSHQHHCPGVGKGWGVTNVAVHIRRGDRTYRKDNAWDAPFPMDYYLNIIQALATAAPPGRTLHFHIYADTEDPQPSPVAAPLVSSISARKRRKATASKTTTPTPTPLAFDELPGLHLRPPEGQGAIPTYYEAEMAGEVASNGTTRPVIFVHPNGDPARAFHCMVNADVLVLSPSQMSYVMAWVTKAVVVYPYFKLKDDLIVLRTDYSLKRAAGALLWLDQEGHSFIPVLDEKGEIDPDVAHRRLLAIRQGGRHGVH